MASIWKAEIARIARWKQLAAARDTHDAIPWHAPAVGASAERIAAAERTVGQDFSSEFKEFLCHADGWKCFYVLVDLFGTADFIGERAAVCARRPELASFVARAGLAKTIVIGASDYALDTFLLVSPRSRTSPGSVVWFASQEVDRYASFSEFFAAMVNYNARIAQTVGRA